MDAHLYLSMLPESLVASMLPPEDFGTYLAVGTKKRSRGQAMFFDLDPDFQSDYFDLSTVADRCVPHDSGEPKHSVYISIYRVLEHVPPGAFRSLWLVTSDGRVLQLDKAPVPAEFAGAYHLYKEICPVHPLIASTMAPDAFCRFITDPDRPFQVPRICFVDMALSELADDPENGKPMNLPYPHLDHLRDCLLELKSGAKETKTVDRIDAATFPIRCVKTGFYVGNRDEMLFYPFPSREELKSQYYPWWRSANV